MESFFRRSIRANSLSVIVSVALISCTQPSAAPRYTSTAAPRPLAPPLPLTKTIQILSEPPGARIEVNDDYIGEAPCSAQVRCDSEGRFFETTRIRALPVGYGYTQGKYFSGYGQMNNPYLHSDPVPSRIFFDMRLGPVSPDINVNVNQ